MCGNVHSDLCVQRKVKPGRAVAQSEQCSDWATGRPGFIHIVSLAILNALSEVSNQTARMSRLI